MENVENIEKNNEKPQKNVENDEFHQVSERFPGRARRAEGVEGSATSSCDGDGHPPLRWPVESSGPA